MRNPDVYRQGFLFYIPARFNSAVTDEGFLSSRMARIFTNQDILSNAFQPPAAIEIYE
jgi:hypothetical protein